MRSQLDRVDELVASLATVHDEDLTHIVEPPRSRELFEAIVATPAVRARRDGRVLLAIGGIAAAAAATVGLLVGGSHGTQTASAATALKKAAKVARAHALPVARPGQFVYTKTVYSALDTYVDKGATYSALMPWSRESWLGPTGGRMRQVPGTPRFLSDRDREAWIAAGRPSFAGPDSGAPTPLPAAKPLDLPTDSDRLFARLKAEAASYGPRLYDEMFVEVGDSLRETNASPEQRAALYAVAARIPGVELAGRIVDSAGRTGIAVSKDDAVNHIRSTLVFDPDTSVLLGEQQETLAGNSLGYPAGTKIESVTYLRTAVVDSIGARD